jgi:SM-20-related protein
MVDQILQEIERCGHANIQNVLSADELRVINHFFEGHKTEFKPAMVGAKDNKQRVESVRGDYTFWIDPLDPVDPFGPVIQFLNKLKEGANSSFYLGLQQFECHLAFYPVGTFYQKHLDRFETQSSRSLSFVFYLNEKWNEENGGELILYDKNNQMLKTIYPLPGSAVCFLSDEFPHEVKSGNLERRSLTGWMHTKIIY